MQPPKPKKLIKALVLNVDVLKTIHGGSCSPTQCKNAAY